MKRFARRAVLRLTVVEIIADYVSGMMSLVALQSGAREDITRLFKFFGGRGRSSNSMPGGPARLRPESLPLHAFKRGNVRRPEPLR